MPELSEEERAQRQRQVDCARINIELSGYELTAEARALSERYVVGELSSDAFTEALLAHARSLPAGEPRQEYFATLEEARKAGEQ